MGCECSRARKAPPKGGAKECNSLRVSLELVCSFAATFGGAADSGCDLFPWLRSRLPWATLFRPKGLKNDRNPDLHASNNVFCSPAGSMQSAVSFLGEFTVLLTGYTSKKSSGAGISSGWSESASWFDGSSQRA